MHRYFAFLRAINVGGHTVTMSRLRDAFESLGASDVATFIASGNVVFSTRARAIPALERSIAQHLEVELGFPVATFVRTEAELAAIVAAGVRPFKGWSARPPSVGLVHRALSQRARRTLQSMASPIDRFHVLGREVYWSCRKGQLESKFSGAVFERTFGVPVTFRTLNTFTRMATRYLP